MEFATADVCSCCNTGRNDYYYVKVKEDVVKRVVSRICIGCFEDLYNKRLNARTRNMLQRLHGRKLKKWYISICEENEICFNCQHKIEKGENVLWINGETYLFNDDVTIQPGEDVGIRVARTWTCCMDCMEKIHVEIEEIGIVWKEFISRSE